MAGLIGRPLRAANASNLLPLCGSYLYPLANPLFASASASTSAPESPNASPPSIPSKSPTWPVQPHNQKVAASYRPWDYTRTASKRKNISSRMGFLMQTLDLEKVREAQTNRKFPNFTSGDILEVRVTVPEAQRKEYVYKGVCIARYNKGIATSFKLYNVFPEVGGFIQHLPLYMPDLLEVKVVGRVQVAPRSKLFYLMKDETSAQTYQSRVKPE
eukprot:gene17621-23959_t